MNPESIETRHARLEAQVQAIERAVERLAHVPEALSTIREQLREADEDDMRAEVAIHDLRNDIRRELDVLDRRIGGVDGRVGTTGNVAAGQVAALRREIAAEKKARADSRKSFVKWLLPVTVALLGVIIAALGLLIHKGGL